MCSCLLFEFSLCCGIWVSSSKNFESKMECIMIKKQREVHICLFKTKRTIYYYYYFKHLFFFNELSFCRFRKVQFFIFFLDDRPNFSFLNARNWFSKNYSPFQEKKSVSIFLKTDEKHLLLLFMGRGEIRETQK